MPEMKLGKLPARPDAVQLKLADYLDLTKLPPIPSNFGHERVVSAWQMLGNDQYGDCVWAGAAHETMLWNATVARAVSFTDSSVLSDYSACTGFSADDPNSDQGTDVQLAASYRRRTGIVDAAGHRHTVAAYLALKPGNLTELYAAAYLFGAVGIGIGFPDSAMSQFNAGQPWTVQAGAQVQGGHYVPVVARRGGWIDIITWGRIQPMAEAFYTQYCDEAVVYLSEEYLSGGKSPEGFDDTQLRADLTAVASA